MSFSLESDMTAADLSIPDLLRTDYADFYSIVLIHSDVRTMPLEEWVVSFFMGKPEWIRIAMKIRNKLVALVGLKAGNVNYEEILPKIEAGTSIGIFDVYENSENIIRVGLEDSHLDFVLSFVKLVDGNHQKIVVATQVQYNNLLGRIYFFFVKPFHKLVVRSMLSKIDYRQET